MYCFSILILQWTEQLIQLAEFGSRFYPADHNLDHVTDKMVAVT